MDSLISELERLWEEQQREWERDRIRDEIQKYENKKSEALSLISNAEGYLSEYDVWLDKIIKLYKIEDFMMQGQIVPEYNRVYDLAGNVRMDIISNYETTISSAVSLVGEIDKKISELIAELNSI